VVVIGNDLCNLRPPLRARSIGMTLAVSTFGIVLQNVFHACHLSGNFWNFLIGCTETIRDQRSVESVTGCSYL